MCITACTAAFGERLASQRGSPISDTRKGRHPVSQMAWSVASVSIASVLTASTTVRVITGKTRAPLFVFSLPRHSRASPPRPRAEP